MDDILFRNAMGKFATGVTVLTTLQDGVPYGMTANAFMSVSLDPKLIAISIGHKARFLEKVTEAQKFGVSILGADQEDYSRVFAGQTDGLPQFVDLAGMPVLDGAVVQLACEVVSTHIEGDHTLFIGKVVNIQIEDKNPLLFFGGKYRKLAELANVES